MMVGLDIDGVLADFLSPFLRLLEKRTGTGRIDPQAYIDLNFSAHPAFSSEIVIECILKVSNDPQFWEQLYPLPSAAQWEILDGLSRKHQLIFITHRYECDNYSIHQVTCDWLRKHGVSDPVVYFTRSYKSELIAKLKVGLFVDDRHENCQDVAENTNAVVLMPHRPYNQTFSHPGVQRIQDLDELLPFLA
jgi:5' nucleotidase, deoxy (Pyrimidine), cytosolic type C protein (NT5C)